MRVCVIGGGINGLCSAMLAMQRIPGVQLTIVADNFAKGTTSEVAMGMFFPYLLGQTPEHLIRKWSKSTLHFLQGLLASDPVESGVLLLHGYMLCAKPEDDMGLSSLGDLLISYKAMTRGEDELFPAKYHGKSFSFTTLIAEGSIYLQWLLSQCRKLGARFVKKHISSLEEMYSDYDAIINCSGLEAQKLSKDDQLQPGRGQAMRISAPWLRHALAVEGGKTWLIPGHTDVLVGITKQPGDWDTTVRSSDAKRMWEDAVNIVPALKDAPILRHDVGLRPLRSKVRVEQETIVFNGKIKQIIHNYGHGGAAYSLHYGCAEDVVNMIKAHSKL